MIYRHGDLILKEVPHFTTGVETKTNVHVLAEGELTGHRHVLSSSIPITVINTSRHQWVALDAPAKLTHEEHKALIISPGIYQIMKEREYDYVNTQTSKRLD